MITTEDGSTYTRKLPLGCEQCIQGEKLVFFVGGICQLPANCSWYCPISEEKKGKPTKYVNERPFQAWEDLWDEIDKTGAKGLSITGGDPLYSEELQNFVLELISSTKKRLGASFHIHLYTNGQNFSPKLAEALASAGLDEIRFHPSIDDFNVFSIARAQKLCFGAEVPAIPTEENERYLEKLLVTLEETEGSFLNLNELEMTPPNAGELKERGFQIKEDSLAAVGGSAEFARQFITNHLKSRVSLHFCPAAVKDSTQLRQRYFHRANKVKRPYEEVTPEGLLVKGVVRGPYEHLLELRSRLIEEGEVPPEMLFLPEGSNTLEGPAFLITEKEILRIIKKSKLEAGIIETLPLDTRDVCEYSPL
ncbi:MAG: radical SAM domain-containing protein [Promethearchaeota archaeon CR_4]|nr:MAG: radical SAM domain-containing protein [Candidatus Lokiarchaeota archaeon CR_4]